MSMFKYKWDKMQIAIMCFFVLNAIALMYFPYKINTLEESVYYGYKAFLHWVILIYTLRITMHVFGMEVYNMKGNVIGLLVIMGASTYFKIFLGRREDFAIMYSGVIVPFLTLILLIGVILVDSYLYVIEKKEA